MIPLVILSTLFGAVLGLRLKVLILVPAIVLVASVVLGFGIAHGDSLWSYLLAMGLAITALQMGYLGGVITRFVIAGTRLPSSLPKPTAAFRNSAR